MRAFKQGDSMGTGISKAADKSRASETSMSAHGPKVPSKRPDKLTDNPRHREDFQRLLRRAVSAK